MGKLQGMCCCCVCAAGMWCAVGGRVTHHNFRRRKDRQVHVQVVIALSWCLRVGRVRFGSMGVAHH